MKKIYYIDMSERVEKYLSVLELSYCRDAISFGHSETDFLFYNVDMSKLRKRNIYKLFGSVSIPSGCCYACNQNSFIIDGMLQCCNRKIEDNIEFKGFERVATDDDKRIIISKAMKKKILTDQEYCCLYCETPFHFRKKRNGKSIKLKIQYDHLVPFAYLNDNSFENIAAACHVCNLLKSSMIFQTVDEAKVYLEAKRARKGYNF